MISNSKLAKWVYGGALVGAVMAPAVAVAQEAATTAAPAVAWQVSAARAFSAALALGLAALAAGYAQAKIGAAGAGTLAERPEAATMVLVLQALPEVIVLLGFVIAFMINAG